MLGRVVVGGVVAGIILFVVGFIFWATPLGELAYKGVDHPRSAAVHTALAQNLTESGAGAYRVPDARTREGAALYARGPVAVVHFNSRGYSPDDMSMILPGFLLAIASGLLIAFGLAAAGGGRSFASLARLVVLFAVGITAWTILGQPLFNHFGWGYWVYSFVAETTALVLAGLAVAKWFLPREHRAEGAPVLRDAASTGSAAPQDER